MKLVIFDVDGHAGRQPDYICEAQRRAFVQHGLEPPPRQLMLSIVGLSLVRAFETLAPHAPAESMAEAYKNAGSTCGTIRRGTIRCFPARSEIIEALSRRDDVSWASPPARSRNGVANRSTRRLGAPRSSPCRLRTSPVKARARHGAGRVGGNRRGPICRLHGGRFHL